MFIALPTGFSSRSYAGEREVRHVSDEQGIFYLSRMPLDVPSSGKNNQESLVSVLSIGFFGFNLF